MRKIIISGHSGGLGRALAEHYLQQDWHVLGVSRSVLPQQPNLCQRAIDLADDDALDNWLQSGELAAFIEDADEIVLINNAGTVLPSAVCGRQMPSEIAAAVMLNVAAPLMLSNYVLSARAPQTPLKIAHIGSGAGRNAYAGWSVYGATKAALDHHARCLVAEQHDYLRVASIAPGVVDTPMQAQIRTQNGEDFPILARFEALKENGGLSSPQQTAAAIAAMIAHEDFGLAVIQDVRTWQSLQDTFQTASVRFAKPSENQ